MMLRNLQKISILMHLSLKKDTKVIFYYIIMMILFPQWSIWVIDDVVITSRELLLPVSDEVVHQVWMVEWMRGLCAGGALGGGGRQMDMWSTQREWFPPLHHTRTRRTAPADESLHRCDKYTGLIVARRRNNGQKKMSRSVLWSSPDEWDTSVWTLVQQRAVYSRTPLQKRQEVELFSYFSAQFEHLAHWVSPWGLLIWPGLIAP